MQWILQIVVDVDCHWEEVTFYTIRREENPDLEVGYREASGKAETQICVLLANSCCEGIHSSWNRATL